MRFLLSYLGLPWFNVGNQQLYSTSYLRNGFFRSHPSSLLVNIFGLKEHIFLTFLSNMCFERATIAHIFWPSLGAFQD